VANFLVKRLSNIRWLCGYTGSNGILLVTGREAHFITDGRYTNQAKEQVRGAQIHIYSGGASVADAFIHEMKSNRTIKFRGRIGIEAPFMTVDFYQLLKRTFPNCALVETENIVEDLMMQKDAHEIKSIRKAVIINDEVFKAILPQVKPGTVERDIATEIIYLSMKRGAQSAFEPIVASGPRSALPHGIASDRKIGKNEFVTIDMGCFSDGYPSDMTRTVVVGKANPKQREIYNIVHEAQARAIAAAKPGAKCSDVDAVARDYITHAGYGENFTHGLGHGLGLEVHSRPTVNKISKTVLSPSMVITIEPGIYIEGFGGVRIEDDLLITENGCEVLNRTPKELIEL
jgi:Xaa-Pro aminopeptidase